VVEMFINNINPVIATIGPFEIRYYGLVYAIGFLVAYFLLRSIAKKKTIPNFSVEKADTFMLYLIIGAIAGARLLLFVFYYPKTLITNPLEVFMTWHGGMSFHGGLVGAVIAGLIFCKRHKVSFYKLADFLVLPLALFLIFGRIANFINGELVGKKTNVPWCVVFKDYEGCRHPSQLYESAKNLAIFITLSILYFNKELKKKFKDGIIFWLFVLMYGVLRFIITFWRDDPRFLGLSGGQYLCILMVVVSIYFLFRITRIKKREDKKKLS
jgi:phosphatidylglycerol:prolipoprotein diacylglycerol transferase